MTSIDLLKKRLANKKIVIMDGGTGTELLHHGQKTTLPLWSAGPLLTSPEVVKDIHTAYIKAGAEIIITNTFRTTKRTFAKVGLEKKARETTILACQMAKEAVIQAKPKHDVYIAGSIAPLEDCYTPTAVPSDKNLREEHLEHAKNLKDGGVDFLLVETMNTIKEAVFALEAAKLVGLPIAISFCCNDTLTLLSGESIGDAVEQIKRYSPLFISINCTPAHATTHIVKKLRRLTKLPIGAYANGDGCADETEGWRFIGNVTKEDYLKQAAEWVESGVQVIGGCCGTDPSYIKLLAQKLPKQISA